jgi:hypothetical protein
VLVTVPTGVVAAPTAVVALPAVALTLAVALAFTARSEGLTPADASDPCEEDVPDPDCRGAAHEGLSDPRLLFPEPRVDPAIPAAADAEALGGAV